MLTRKIMLHSHSYSHSRSSMRSAGHCGFTLVEVLVSLVVLSIGLLGMAKLVLVSSHSNDSAYMRSQATSLAYEMLDNMRANLGGATAHTYDTMMGAMPTAPTSCNGASAGCSNTQLALWDVYTWKQHLTAAVVNGALPGGTASVATSGTFPMTATIMVQWDDSAARTAFGVISTGVAAPTSITLETVLE
ncbi:MAG: type IV pilus modification protein PilV [Steroidobacteraceae bacterium]